MAIFIDADTFTTDKVLNLIALEGYDTSIIQTSKYNNTTLFVPVGIGKIATIEVGQQSVRFIVEDTSLDYTFEYAVHNTAIFGRGLRKWVDDVKDMGVIINRITTDMSGF